MALNFDEMIADAKRIEADGGQAAIHAAVSTLQTDGTCMWATGGLEFDPGGAHGLIFGFPSLRSSGFSMMCYFSNRAGSDIPREPGTIGPAGDPFYHGNTESMSFRLSLSPFQGRQSFPPIQNFAATMKFEGTPRSFSVPLTRTGDLLTGIGPAIASSGQVDHAVYSFGFTVGRRTEVH